MKVAVVEMKMDPITVDPDCQRLVILKAKARVNNYKIIVFFGKPWQWSASFAKVFAAIEPVVTDYST